MTRNILLYVGIVGSFIAVIWLLMELGAGLPPRETGALPQSATGEILQPTPHHAIVLNIGYDLGILSPEVFAMLVLMALATTFMTGPLLHFINWYFKPKTAELPFSNG